MENLKTITWTEWEDKYKPHSTEQDGLVRYWDEDEVEVARKENRLWTQLDVDRDDIFVIANGFHYVNRLDHFICEVPYEDGDLIEAIDD